MLLGFTFKENCPDIRNTKVVDVYETLAEYTHNVTVYDPHAEQERVKHEYGIEIVNSLPDSAKYDAVILTVAHEEFLKLDVRSLAGSQGVVYDVKSVLPKDVVDKRL